MYPSDASCTPSLPLRGIWEGPHGRFASISSASGYLRAQTLRGAALEKARLGWPDNQIPNDSMGDVSTVANEKVNIAFRFGVDQAGKLRAFDDLKSNHVNLHCTV